MKILTAAFLASQLPMLVLQFAGVISLETIFLFIPTIIFIIGVSLLLIVNFLLERIINFSMDGIIFSDDDDDEESKQKD